MMPYKDKEKAREKAKEYSKKCYEKNKPRRLALAKVWHDANFDRHKELRISFERKRRQEIAAYKMECGCAICGYRGHPDALDFDHLPGHEKTGNISQMNKRKWSVVLAEMEKCRVLCANCHRIETASRSREKKEIKKKEKAEQQLKLHLA